MPLDDGTATKFTPKGPFQQRLGGEQEAACTVALSADGRTAISGGWDGVVRVWDLERLEEVRQLHGHRDSVLCVAITSQGVFAVTGSADGEIRTWDVQRGTQGVQMAGHTSAIRGVAFSPDGHFIASASLDQTVRLWDRWTGRQIKVMTDVTPCTCLAFTADGRDLAVGRWDGSVSVWSLPSGTLTKKLTGHRGCVLDVVVSSDGWHILSAAVDGTVRRWDLASGEELSREIAPGEHVSVTCLATSSDMKGVGCYDGQIRLFRTGARSATRTIRAHRTPVRCIAIAAESSQMVSAAWDGELIAWNLLAQPIYNVEPVASHP